MITRSFILTLRFCVGVSALTRISAEVPSAVQLRVCFSKSKDIADGVNISTPISIQHCNPFTRCTSISSSIKIASFFRIAGIIIFTTEYRLLVWDSDAIPCTLTKVGIGAMCASGKWFRNQSSSTMVIPQPEFTQTHWSFVLPTVWTRASAYL